jgi:hypothetical protein
MEQFGKITPFALKSLRQGPTDSRSKPAKLDSR